MKLVISENEALQKEQDRLIEVQAKLINESRKRDQELRKQVNIHLVHSPFKSVRLASD